MNDLKIRDEYLVKDEDKLRDICGHTTESIWAKATTVITEPMQQFIAMSPFCCLSSQNSEHQTDLSPRGNPAGFVTVANESTLLMPDRPGNRRYDTMRNAHKSSLLFSRLYHSYLSNSDSTRASSSPGSWSSASRPVPATIRVT